MEYDVTTVSRDSRFAALPRYVVPWENVVVECCSISPLKYPCLSQGQFCDYFKLETKTQIDIAFVCMCVSSSSIQT